MKENISHILDVVWKSLKIIVLVALLLFCAVYFQKKREEYAKKRDISNVTGMVISDMQKIVELSTVKYYEDVIMFDTKYDNFWGKLDTVAVVILKGTATVGFDLAKMKDRDIAFEGDTLVVRLPEPEILDVIINPSDVELFDYAKGWNYDEGMPRLSKMGKARIQRNVKSSGALEKASVSGTKALTDIFGAVCKSPVRVIAGGSPQPTIGIPSSPAGN